MNSCSNVDVLHNMPVVQTEKLSKSTDSSEIKAMKSCQVMYLVLTSLVRLGCTISSAFDKP